MELKKTLVTIIGFQGTVCTYSMVLEIRRDHCHLKNMLITIGENHSLQQPKRIYKNFNSWYLKSISKDEINYENTKIWLFVYVSKINDRMIQNDIITGSWQTSGNQIKQVIELHSLRTIKEWIIDQGWCHFDARCKN